MDRRHFLKAAGAAGLVGLAPGLVSPTPALGQAGLSGADLSGWELALGDGVWAGVGQADPDDGDIALGHHGTHSVISANTLERGVMAHAIAFKRIQDPNALDRRHTCRCDFRLPELPTTSNWDYNAQTIEGGFFIWDGPNTRLDYGLAFQWVVNPWVQHVGRLQSWDMAASDGQWWRPGRNLALDTEWHALELVYDHRTLDAQMSVDGQSVTTGRLARTPKPSNWSDTVDARFQLEIISVWPGANPSVPTHRAEFRNWTWDRTP